MIVGGSVWFGGMVNMMWGVVFVDVVRLVSFCIILLCIL